MNCLGIKHKTVLWETTTLFSKQSAAKFPRTRGMTNKNQKSQAKQKNQSEMKCYWFKSAKEKKKYCSISSVQSTWQALVDVSWRNYKEFRDKERCGAAERRCQSFCLGGLIQRCLDTALSPLHTYSSRIFILRGTPLLQSCIFLE